MRSKYVIHVLALLALIFFCDRGLYALLSAGFACTETGESGGIVNKARKTQAEAVVLGSSRAVHQYDPGILSATLKLSVYNAGCNGQEVAYLRGIADLLLHDYTPKLFIINVDENSIQDSEEQLNEVTTLAPFIDDSPAIRDMIFSRSTLEPIKYISRAYRFNSKPLAILSNLVSTDTTHAGYRPITRTLDPEKTTAKPLSSAVADSRMTALLEETVRQAARAGTAVVFVHSPRWSSDFTTEKDRKNLLIKISAIAEKQQVPFLCLTQGNSPAFRNPELFADTAHLNQKGSQLFSQTVANWILELRIIGTYF